LEDWWTFPSACCATVRVVEVIAEQLSKDVKQHAETKKPRNEGDKGTDSAV